MLCKNDSSCVMAATLVPSEAPARRSEESPQQFADRFGALGRRPYGPGADVVTGARVDAQGAVDRREQVALRDGQVLDVLAVGIGGAVDLPALDAATGQDDGPAADEVVAAGAVVDLRRPPDLAHP